MENVWYINEPTLANKNNLCNQTEDKCVDVDGTT